MAGDGSSVLYLRSKDSHVAEHAPVLRGGGNHTLVMRVRGSTVVALNRTVPGRSVEMLEIRAAS